MTRKQRLFIQRELIAYFAWVRDGQTFPNALGYKPTTVEYALMRGETGGDVISTSRVPLKYNGDENIEVIHRAYWRLPDPQKGALYGVFGRRMPERVVAGIAGVSRHEVRKRLNEGYKRLYMAVSREE